MPCEAGRHTVGILSGAQDWGLQQRTRSGSDWHRGTCLSTVIFGLSPPRFAYSLNQISSSLPSWLLCCPLSRLSPLWESFCSYPLASQVSYWGLHLNVGRKPRLGRDQSSAQIARPWGSSLTTHRHHQNFLMLFSAPSYESNQRLSLPPTARPPRPATHTYTRAHGTQVSCLLASPAPEPALGCHVWFSTKSCHKEPLSRSDATLVHCEPRTRSLALSPQSSTSPRCLKISWRSVKFLQHCFFLCWPLPFTFVFLYSDKLFHYW